MAAVAQANFNVRIQNREAPVFAEGASFNETVRLVKEVFTKAIPGILLGLLAGVALFGLVIVPINVAVAIGLGKVATFLVTFPVIGGVIEVIKPGFLQKSINGLVD
jgi:hypothetical protein